MNIKYNYTPYYLDTILNYSTGFKPVIGGTGLGKTYGLIQAILESIKEKPEVKYIYSTNRHALIQEVIKDLEESNIPYVYLKSDKEVFLDLHKEEKLENILYDLIEQDFFLYDKKLGNKTHKKIKDELKKQLDFIQNFQKVSDIHRDNDEEVTSIIETYVLKIVRLLKTQFYLLRKNNPSTHQEFLKDSNIWQLFPYIEYEQNKNAKILLATIQKLCYGFFDGTKKQKLPIFKDKIIFLDEFDFLENEILKVLAQETPLANPLEFVKIFYERFDVLKNKSFWYTTDSFQLLRHQLEQTHKTLSKTIRQNKFKFPQLTDFVYDEKYEQRNVVLFQTNRTIFSENFYLKQNSDAYEVVKYPRKDTVKPLYLFRMVKDCVKQILDIFNEHIQQNEQIVDFVIQKIWNVKNDNKPDANEKYIKDTSLYNNIEINEANTQQGDFDYVNGFSLIKLDNKNSYIAPLDADLQQIELSTSPEAIINRLASRNLVFGLSATGDIPRIVNCFHKKWLKNNCQFIKPSSADKELLLKMKEEKDAVRQSQVAFSPNIPLRKNNPLAKKIDTLKDKFSFFDNGTTTDDFTKNARADCVKIILGCMDWILQKSQNKSHLIFVNSFTHIKRIFDKDIESPVREQINKTLEIESPKKGYYQLKWNDKTCNIVFLNAQKAKEIEEYGDDTYNSFMNSEEVDKVILITQYATASNGVNLGFQDQEGIKRDFEGVHLLETRHYWFDTKNEDSQTQIVEKQTFWYLWKLLDVKEIGLNQFKYYLRQSGANVNSMYKNTKEHCLNAIALFHQALGRVERQRTYKQPIIEVTLGEDVLGIFRNFLKPEYQDISEIREKLPYTATIITQLYDKTNEYTQDKRIELINTPAPNIFEQENKSKTFISSLLNELEKIKQGKYQSEPEIAKEIISIWKQIREIVLSQSYQTEIPLNSSKLIFGKKKLICNEELIFETDLIQDEAKLYITLPEDDSLGYDLYAENPIVLDNIREWDLNRPFLYAKKNKVIAKHFNEKNYLLHYQTNNHLTKKIFTPFIEQAILRGAIGEEAIGALLEHNKVYLQELDDVDFRIFEVADAKVADLPIYIDFKNFSISTVEKYILYNTDWEDDTDDFNPKSLAKKIVNKIDKIHQITGENNIKIVLINFVLKGNFKNQYFTKDLKQVDYLKDCDIAVIPSSINPTKPNQLFKGFRTFIDYIQDEFSK